MLTAELIDHCKNPRHFGRLSNPDLTARIENRSCGDRVVIDLNIDSSGTIVTASGVAVGCALVTSSLSLFLGAVQGVSLEIVNTWSINEPEKWIGMRPGVLRINCANLPLAAVQQLKWGLTATETTKGPKVDF